MARKRPNSSFDTYEPLEKESSSDKENFDSPVQFIKTQKQATKGPGLLLAHEGHLYWHQKGDMDVSAFGNASLAVSTSLGIFIAQPGPKFFNTQNPVKGRFIDCLGDGNCLYRALSICLSSHEENHALLRLIVGTFLLRHQNEDWCDMNMEPGIEPMKALLPCKTLENETNGDVALTFWLFDCNVLVYNSEFKQWTIFTPLMESAPRYSDVQDMLLPTFALINTGIHYQVIDYLL